MWQMMNNIILYELRTENRYYYKTKRKVKVVIQFIKERIIFIEIVSKDEVTL